MVRELFPLGHDGVVRRKESQEVRLNTSRNWVLASATPFPHSRALMTQCCKLSSTGLQDQFGTQAGKISRAPTQYSSSEVQLHLHPVFHLAFLAPVPKAQNPPYTLDSADEDNNNNAVSHINLTLLCTRRHLGCFTCMKQI